MGGKGGGVSHIEIITIGDELVEGRLVDTNAQLMSDRLTDEGYDVVSHLSISDKLAQIAEALQLAAGRSDAVLVSGGLGPTSDDLTAEAAAAAFGLSIEGSETALEHVRKFFADRGRRMSHTNEKQADLPSGCTLLPNPGGTATGFSLLVKDCRLYFMPGVPRELDGMFNRSVIPDLRTFLTGSPPKVATLKVFGKGESDVAQMLEGLEKEVPDGARLLVQYRATFPEIHVRLQIEGPDGNDLSAILEDVARNAAERLGKYVFASGGPRVDTSFPQRVIEDIQKAGLTLAVAEGCTGGEIARHLTNDDRGTHVFSGGVVAPDSSALPNLLEIPCTGNDSEAGTSTRTTEAAAVAVRKLFAADLGLAVTGSPRDSESSPGGLIVAVSSPDQTTSRRFDFPLEPDRFRRLAAYVALGLLHQTITPRKDP